MSNAVAGIINVAVALIGLAALAVLVGQNARTSQVVAATGRAFSDAIVAATGPVLGNNSLQLRPTVGFV
jgi:F420-0:gamma-glutamyl ligase